MSPELYDEIRATRRRIADIIATVEPHERPELWRAISGLDSWLNRHAQYEIRPVTTA